MCTMQIQLRPYQQEATTAFFEALKENRRRQLVVLPTGSGKTVLFGHISKLFHDGFGLSDLRHKLAIHTDRPILVIAHRSELLDQAEQKIHYVWPDAYMGRIQGSRNEQLGEVLLASTQTLVAGREIPNPGLIIFDESHHARASGAFGVLDKLGVFEPDGPILLGVTATPSRSDGTELGDLFEHLTYEKTILQMIMDGYLADVRGIKVSVPGLNLGTVRTTAGDYNAKDLSYAMNGEDVLDAVVDAVKTHAAGRKCIVFAVDVKHSQALAERFQISGVKAASIDGEMSSEERTSILQMFANNHIRILVNCNLLTEGFDQPDVDTVVIARPTRSRSLYTQMVGRGLRLHPNKTDALVLDLTGASEDKSLQTLTTLMRTQRKATVLSQTDIEADDEDTTDALPMDDGESVGEWLTRVEVTKREKQENAERVVEAINLFANRTRYRWQEFNDSFAISYEDGRWAYLYRDGNDYWPVLELNNEKFMPLHDKAIPLAYAQGVAEGFLQLLESKIAQKDADWQAAPMSQRQQYLLDKYRIRYDKSWTRGMASDALSRAFSRRRVKTLMKNFNPEVWRNVLDKPEGREWLTERIERFRVYAEGHQRQAQ